MKIAHGSYSKTQPFSLINHVLLLPDAKPNELAAQTIDKTYCCASLTNDRVRASVVSLVSFFRSVSFFFYFGCVFVCFSMRAAHQLHFSISVFRMIFPNKTFEQRLLYAKDTIRLVEVVPKLVFVKCVLMLVRVQLKKWRNEERKKKTREKKKRKILRFKFASLVNHSLRSSEYKFHSLGNVCQSALQFRFSTVFFFSHTLLLSSFFSLSLLWTFFFLHEFENNTKYAITCQMP